MHKLFIKSTASEDRINLRDSVRYFPKGTSIVFENHQGLQTSWVFETEEKMRAALEKIDSQNASDVSVDPELEAGRGRGGFDTTSV